MAQPPRYDPPLAGPLRVTGTFGELRSDHFHAGLDFRAPTGTPVLAVADGFVSRLTVSGGGYGQAVYVDHPDGHRSVYAHLNALAPELTDTLRARQFATERFAQDLRFDSLAYPVRRGQTLGVVGNRGYSFGSHLHFEVRDRRTDDALNPLAFGFPVPDHRTPAVRKVRLYVLDEDGNERATRTVTPVVTRDGDYVVPDTLRFGSARLGVGVKTYDRQDGMPNWNGIYAGELYADSARVFDFGFVRIPFAQTEYLNALTDYAAWTDEESWYHRFWRLTPGQFHPRLTDTLPGARTQVQGEDGKAGQPDGTLRLPAGRPLPVRVVVADHAGNRTTVRLTLALDTSLAPASAPPPPPHTYRLPAGEGSVIETGDMRLELPATALYRALFFRYARLPDRSANYLSDVHQLHDPLVPLHGRARLTLRPRQAIPRGLRDKVFVGRCGTDGRLSSRGGTWAGDGRLRASIGSFGNYGLFIDTVPPAVEILSFPTDQRRSAGFSLRITDDVAAPLRWRGTVDGAWVLLEYDAKRDRLDYTFAHHDVPPGEHLFELTLTDGRGNVTRWRRRFRR